MKIPDRNSSGRIVAFTIGGEASAFGIAAVSARARAANDSDPTSSVARNSRSGRPVGRSVPYATLPNASVITTRIAATIIECSTRANRYDHDGSGVPRSRLRIP